MPYVRHILAQSAFAECCRCKASGTPTYWSYFKCPVALQMRRPVNADDILRTGMPLLALASAGCYRKPASVKTLKPRKADMHLHRVRLHTDRYPTREHYPFNLSVFQATDSIRFETPVTFFVGENGTGKSTLLEAIARKCGIHIWEQTGGRSPVYNPYKKRLAAYLSADWSGAPVPGSFFGSAVFRDFARMLDQWAVEDPGQLALFGGKSLTAQSHGQSIMSFFRARYRIEGLYLMDEPETALSPRTQVDLLRLLSRLAKRGRAQFIIASHSPILMSCPNAAIYSFDASPIRTVRYEETDHYRLYKRFMEAPHRYRSN